MTTRPITIEEVYEWVLHIADLEEQRDVLELLIQEIQK